MEYAFSVVFGVAFCENSLFLSFPHFQYMWTCLCWSSIFGFGFAHIYTNEYFFFRAAYVRKTSTFEFLKTNDTAIDGKSEK